MTTLNQEVNDAILKVFDTNDIRPSALSYLSDEGKTKEPVGNQAMTNTIV